MNTANDPSDTDLIRRYRKGDLDALALLVSRHRQWLFGYIYHTVQSQAEADDVYQEVWMRVIRKNKYFRGGNFGGWLTRIAHNIIIDRVRRRRPDLSLDAETPDGYSLKDHTPGKSTSPAASMQDADISRQVSEAVAKLPPEQREVFLMRTQQELPFKEIAKIQKTSINTALARMQYALRKLREALGELRQEMSAGATERREGHSWAPLNQPQAQEQ